MPRGGCLLTCTRFTSRDVLPLSLAPAGRCEVCGCRLSLYRLPSDTRCWPCAPDGADDGAAEKAPRGSVPAAIIATLQGGPLSRADLSTVTGCEASSLKAALRVLITNREVERVGDYRVPQYRLRAVGRG